jgi:hypothetical protein
MIQSLTNIPGDPTPLSYQLPGYKTGFGPPEDLLGGISTSDLVLLEHLRDLLSVNRLFFMLQV